MSKNNTINNISELITNIEKNLLKSRLKIVSILMKKYNLKMTAARQMEEKIHVSVRTEMMEKYRFKEPLYTGIELGKKDKPYLELMNEYPDFVDWAFTALTVPFYQSLGDTIGYKNGDREFNEGQKNVTPEYTNDLIYDFISLGGINDLSLVNWIASDDTILYMATLQTLGEKLHNIPEFGKKIRQAYLDAAPLIENRYPGGTTMESLKKQSNIKWDKLQYDSSHKGNGSAMRSGCIGIFFPGKHNRKKLIALAVESSRITHNSAIAILGSITSALFTAYALERIPINHWPHKLIKLLESKKIDEYMQKSRPAEYKLYAQDKILFTGQWQLYVNKRFSGLKPKLDLKIMRHPVMRFKYLSDNFSKGCGTVGGCADDCVIMAYDALLESGNVIEKLIIYAILHPGDSDTVGSVALSWYGALYHSVRNQRLLSDRFDELEFHDDLYDFVENNFNRMAKRYYYDIYLSTARKYLRLLNKYHSSIF